MFKMPSFKYLLSIISMITFIVLCFVVCVNFFNLPHRKFFDTTFSSLFDTQENYTDRTFAISMQKENDIYIILGTNDDNYEKILSTVKKIKQVKGVSWFFNSNEYPSLLDFYKSESYYRDPKITGVVDKGSLLARLERNYNNLSNEELLQVIDSDPFAFKYDFNMPPFEGTSDNLIYTRVENDACGKARKCYLLKGMVNNHEVREGFRLFTLKAPQIFVDINAALEDFRNQGGVVYTFGGALSQEKFSSLLRSEILLIWVIALSILFITFKFIFKSIKPFLTMLFALSTSCALGFMLTVLLCRSIHLLSLVLVLPVISILSYIFLNFMVEHTSKSLRKRAAVLSLIISMITFGALSLSGFSVFVEVSTLATSIILIFFLFVYGFLYWLKPLNSDTVFRHVHFLKIDVKSKLLKVFYGVSLLWLVLTSVSGFMRVDLNIDEEEISNRQINSKEIAYNGSVKIAKSKLGKYLFEGKSVTTLIVTADTPQSLAERLKAIDLYLGYLKNKKEIKNYFTYTNILIPTTEASKNLQFYEGLLDVAKDYYLKRGIKKDVVDALTIPKFKNGPVEQFTKNHSIYKYQEVIDLSDVPFLSVFNVSEISKQNIDKIVKTFPYVEYYDFHQEYLKYIAQHRNDAMILLSLLTLTLFVLVFSVTGLNGTIGMILPAVLGLGTAFEYMHYADIGITIYTIAGAVLIIGMSITSSIFLRQIPKAQDHELMQPVVLGFIINQGVFGILAISDISDISNLGSVVLVGILISTVSGIVLNLIIVPPRKKRDTFFYKFKKMKKMKN